MPKRAYRDDLLPKDTELAINRILTNKPDNPVFSAVAFGWRLFHWRAASMPKPSKKELKALNEIAQSASERFQRESNAVRGVRNQSHGYVHAVG